MRQRRTSMMLNATIVLTLASAAFGQLTGPVMGYLPDGSSLRAINGIPASGSVGPAVTANRNLSLIQVAPGQPLALATAYDTGELLRVTLGSGGAALQLDPVSGAASGATQIVFSPNGSAAALWYAATGHIEILTGLTSTVSVRDVDASFLGGDPSALAVSDDGQWAAGSWAGKNYGFGPAAQVIALPVDGSAEALNFLHAKQDVAIITASQVATVADIGGAAVPTVLWSLPAGVAPSPDAPTAVGIAASADNSLLVIAANTGALFTLNVATGAGTPANCDCQPSGLSSVGDSTFRLNGVNAGVIKLFDAATNDVWFVPMSTAVVGGGQQ
jgi:hypothetical protein